MKNIRFTAIFLLKFLERYKAAVLAVLIILIFIGVLIVKVGPSVSKDTISEGLVGTYTENDLPKVVTALLSQGLVTLAPNGEPKANLVTGWQVNSDATEYTFKLKKGLKWLDGSDVKASDIAPEVSDAHMSVVDDQTFKLKLDDSFSPLPTLLTKPILKKGSNIGIGPYKIDRIETNEVFITRIRLSSSDPDLPNLSIRFYPNENTADEALRVGDVESLLEANQTNDLSGGPFEVISHPNHTRIVTIFYNTQDQVLSDKNFRLALSFATPSIKGEEAAVTSLPGSSWAFNPDVKDFLDNPEQAKASLDKVKNGRDSTITLTSTVSLQNVGKEVVEEWKREGINATLKVESGIPQNFQALLISQDIPLDPDQYSLWHSTQTSTNVSKYSSPRVDKDLEDARKTTDESSRKAKYEDFQKVLIDDSPATFLYFPSYKVVALKKIDGPLKKVLKYQLSDISI